MSAVFVRIVFVRLDDNTIVPPGYMPDEVIVSSELLRELIEEHNELVGRAIAKKRWLFGNRAGGSI